jgi:hypothetical protein
MAAIPDTLLEAELFGASASAYTGADKKGRIGKLQLADGGTLFLDEIGDMPASLQAKLLRVLQDKEFEQLGANRVLRADIRVIAATSAQLEEKVAAGSFRADLYYRLNVLTIRLPPCGNTCRICPSWRNRCWNNWPDMAMSPVARSAMPRYSAWPLTTGRAMCANCAISWSGPACSARATC